MASTPHLSRGGVPRPPGPWTCARRLSQSRPHTRRFSCSSHHRSFSLPAPPAPSQSLAVPPRSPCLSRRRRRASSHVAAASPTSKEKLTAAVSPTTLPTTATTASTTAAAPETTTPPKRQQPLVPSSSSVLALVGVSLLWGTYAPSLRWLFLYDEGLTPATLTAWRTAISAAAMLAAAAATGALSADDGGGSSSDEAAEGTESESTTESSFSSSSSPSSSSSSWVRAGAEIGLYNFLGTACQVTGVHATTATKAAFLGQATTALTPALAALGGLKVTGVQWLACAAAVAGSALIAADDVALSSAAAASATAAASAAAAVEAAATASSSAPALSGGEPFVLLACVFYALSTVRMAVHAPRHSAARLATAKTSALAALSIVWACGVAAASGASSGAAGAAGEASSSLFSFLALPPILAGSAVGLAALAFSALGPGALATWLQASGQRSVPAAEAQVIFSLTPVWTALLSACAAAAGVAGASAAESAMGTGAWAGSALVLAASVAVALEGRGAGVGGDGGEEEKG